MPIIAKLCDNHKKIIIRNNTNKMGYDGINILVRKGKEDVFIYDDANSLLHISLHKDGKCHLRIESNEKKRFQFDTSVPSAFRENGLKLYSWEYDKSSKVVYPLTLIFSSLHAYPKRITKIIPNDRQSQRIDLCNGSIQLKFVILKNEYENTNRNEILNYHKQGKVIFDSILGTSKKLLIYSLPGDNEKYRKISYSKKAFDITILNTLKNKIKYKRKLIIGNSPSNSCDILFSHYTK